MRWLSTCAELLRSCWSTDRQIWIVYSLQDVRHIMAVGCVWHRQTRLAGYEWVYCVERGEVASPVIQWQYCCWYIRAIDWVHGCCVGGREVVSECTDSHGHKLYYSLVRDVFVTSTVVSQLSTCMRPGIKWSRDVCPFLLYRTHRDTCPASTLVSK